MDRANGTVYFRQVSSGCLQAVVSFRFSKSNYALAMPIEYTFSSSKSELVPIPRILADTNGRSEICLIGPIGVME